MIRNEKIIGRNGLRRYGLWQFALLVCLLAVLNANALAQSLGFQITPDHTGQLYFPSMSPPLSMKWSVNLGGTVSYPIVVGSRIFVVAGTNSAELMALDAATGGVLWMQAAPPPNYSWAGAAYENGTLFALGLFQGMYAFSAIDGHQVWSASFPYGDFLYPPTALNGIVYASSGDGTVAYAVRESDGAVLWTTSIGYYGNSAPAVTSEGAYFAYPCGNTYKLSLMGQQIWSYDGTCYGGTGSSAAVYQGLVYVRSVYGLPSDSIRLHAADGSYAGGYDSKYVPAFWQNIAFYIEPNYLAGFDVDTSRFQWVQLPQNGDSYSCGAIVVNGIVYSATTNGKLYGYSADSGNQMFSANLGQGASCPQDGPYWTPPLSGLAAGNGLLVVPAGSQLVAYQFTNFGHWQFVPTTPCRLVDTRQTHNPIQGGTTQNFNIPQLGGCNIPSSATAYSLNVAVVPHGTLGYLTVWPTGEQQPTVSTMNSYDGRVKANAAIVPSGYQDNISVYATDTTDVILDINGYFTPPASGTYQFYPLTPCRVIDTRNPVGPLGGPRLEANSMRDFPVLMSSCIPSGVNPIAYSFNVAVVPNPSGQPLNYLTLYPAGQSLPAVATLNNPTATVVANAAIVPAGTSGDIEAYAYNSTDMIVDINGYFAAPGSGGLSLYPSSPCRVLDTRNGNGLFHGELNPPVNVVNSACAPPPQAKAYVLSATVVPSGLLDYLTLWPDGQDQPNAATLNAWDGAVTSNMAIVPTNNGSIDAFADGTTQLILDISSYFAP